MRPQPDQYSAAAISPAPPPPTVQCKYHGGCRWWPYTDSNDFQSNAVLILVILFTALICALALNGILRCLLKRRNRDHQRKAAVNAAVAAVAVAPAVEFWAGMELTGAEAECAICLSEFEEGEKIRVLENCKHGFHVQCIEKWLVSRTSCPFCRRSCLSDPSKDADEKNCGNSGRQQPVEEEA